MRYAVVVMAALAVGVTVYVLTLRRSNLPDTRSFGHQGPEMSSAPVHVSSVTYIPVATGTPASWRSRSTSLVGLAALITVCAATIAVTLYKVGSVLIRVIIHKLQGS